jgi:hypothetical protein
MTEIVYSVTVKPNVEIQNEFIAWLKEEHIQEVINTGCFDSARFFKLLDENETDGSSFNIQYSTTEMSRYFDYINNFANEMRQKGLAKFGDQFVAFRSILRSV